MRIDDLGGPGGPHRPDGAGQTGNRSEASSKPPVEQDRLELSEAARRRLHLFEAAKRLPEIREERVSELRSAIESGSYEVDARRVARAILEFEHETFR